MAYIKQEFKDGNVLTAEQLNHIEDGIAGLTETDLDMNGHGIVEVQYLNIGDGGEEGFYLGYEPDEENEDNPNSLPYGVAVFNEVSDDGYVRLRNIAPGRHSYDAATKGQLDTAIKETIDKTCPAINETAVIVTCEPVEGYPLQVEWNKKNLIGFKDSVEESTNFTITTQNGLLTRTVKSKIASTVLIGTASLNKVALNTTFDPGTYVLSLHNIVSSGVESHVTFYATVKLSDGTELTMTPGVATEFNQSWTLMNILTPQVVWEDGSSISCNVQIERGSVATAYEPYVEAPTAITRCGKNLVKIDTTTTTKNGVTFTVNEDGSIIVDGTATADVFFVAGRTTLYPGYTYHLSGGFPGGGYTTHALYIYHNGIYYYDHGAGTTFNGEAKSSHNIYIKLTKGATLTSAVMWPMLRLDGTDAAFEKFQGGTFEQGDTIPALPGVNTVYADAGLVTVTGRANPATIIEKLTNAILSMGGNV